MENPWGKWKSSFNLYSEVTPKFKFLLQAIKMKIEKYLNLKNIERRYRKWLNAKNVEGITLAH